jgi:hypothetical protein
MLVEIVETGMTGQLGIGFNRGFDGIRRMLITNGYM